MTHKTVSSTPSRPARAPRVTQEAAGAPVIINEVSDKWSKIGNNRYGQPIDHDGFYQHDLPEFVPSRPREGVIRRRVNRA